MLEPGFTLAPSRKDAAPINTITPRRVFRSLQMMRGAAATAVVFYHASVIMAQPEYGGFSPSIAPPHIGWIGVNFFFVLSGFIIMHAHATDLGQPSRLAIYAWRRFARVYPIYWIMLGGFIAASFVLHKVDFSLSVANLATAVTLVTFTPVPTLPLKVAWTLLFEVKFYAIFALGILHRKLGIAVALIWLAIIATQLIVPWNAARGFGESWSINFFIGGACCLLVNRVKRLSPIPLCVIGLVAIGYLASANLLVGPSDIQGRGGTMVILGLAFGALLLSGIIAENRAAFFHHPWVALLGDASYAIYLTHSAVISALMIFAARLHLTASANLLYLVAVVASITFGIAAHLLLERPMLHLFRRSSRAKTNVAQSIKERPA
jgi:exopolysaccharide production protein ExoZ